MYSIVCGDNHAGVNVVVLVEGDHDCLVLHGLLLSLGVYAAADDDYNQQ
jgi:hypothetical protein